MSEETAVESVEKTPRLKRIFREIKSVFIIIFVVLIFRSVFFEPFKIPSGSMIPTLTIGDFILVNKFSYGLKLPFSDWFGDPVYLTGPERPNRGDVVVFKYPKNVEINYIKRIVGMPGETIQIIDKAVYVNDKPIKTTLLNPKPYMDKMDEKYKRYNFKFFKSFTGTHEHVIQIDQDNVYSANSPKVEIPAGHYFVMGDNRDFSADSRIWGFVPFNYIKGKAIMIWFSTVVPMPWSKDSESFSIRPERIGNIIE